MCVLKKVHRAPKKIFEQNEEKKHNRQQRTETKKNEKRDDAGTHKKQKRPQKWCFWRGDFVFPSEKASLRESSFVKK